MMAGMPATIRPLEPADVAAVVEFSLRAWAPVFQSFRTVLGERVYQALYPEWATSQAHAVEAGHAPARRVYEKAGFIGLPLIRYYVRLDTDAGHSQA